MSVGYVYTTNGPSRGSKGGGSATEAALQLVGIGWDVMGKRGGGLFGGEGVGQLALSLGGGVAGTCRQARVQAGVVTPDL